MTQTASANLVTALKNSLADSDAGWVVRAATSTKRPSGGSTYDERTTVLSAVSLRSGTASRSEMRITFIGIYGGDPDFVEAFIRANGGEWRTTDSALASTIQTLRTAFLTAQDTALKDALNAGPQDDDGTMIPADMLAALLDSLEDEAHGWAVRSRVENVIPDALQVAVSLGTPDIEASPSGGAQAVPISLNYIADLDPAGALLSARVMIMGAEWRSRDADLHTAVMTLADAYLAAQDTVLTAALEDGPS